MATAIGRQPGIRRVILFGSHAFGRSDADSDVDFMVITTGEATGAPSSTALRSHLRGSPVAVDIVVMDEQEFNETKSVIGGMAYPAHRHGKVLYEKP